MGDRVSLGGFMRMAHARHFVPLEAEAGGAAVSRG
jgi:hypothetical protein